MSSAAASEGDVIVVTGASGNLGAAVLARLQAAGRRVVAVERARARFEDTELAAIDLANPPSVDAALQTIARRLGPIGALVHTVGTYRGGRALLQTPNEDFVELFSTNVILSVNVVRAALAQMLPRAAGRIAVVASADAVHAVGGQSAYGASKAAQLRMLESVAHEVRGRGVTINAVLPGTMDTPQNRAAMPQADRTRWVSLDAVADVLAYLVSPAAGAIHGQAIRVGD
jgi:NAD(P)-dependent dehydrogenase (short-subunit alcohol dehydrogenase family)